MTEPTTITRLLREWQEGDPEAADRLMPLVYDELRRLASAAMRNERSDHTLQPTALVHEAYLRLAGADIAWQDRAHFLAAAATAMRRVLLDHARAKGRAKRGGGAVRLTLIDSLHAGTSASQAVEDFLTLHTALERLAEQNPRRVRVVELRYFGGLNLEESGAVLGLAPSTVHRELKLARAWLYRQMNAAES